MAIYRPDQECINWMRVCSANLTTKPDACWEQYT